MKGEERPQIVFTDPQNATNLVGGKSTARRPAMDRPQRDAKQIGNLLDGVELPYRSWIFGH